MPSTEQLKKKKNRGNIHPKTNKNLTPELTINKNNHNFTKIAVNKSSKQKEPRQT